MTKTVADLRNNKGYIYIVDASSGDVVLTVTNDRGGVESALSYGLISAPLFGNLAALGSITLDQLTADLNNATITAVNVNGVNQISADITLGISNKAVAAITTASDKVEVSGDITNNLEAGEKIKIDGSTGNDGIYTVNSITYNGGSSNTEIVTSENIGDATADGNVYYFSDTASGMASKIVDGINSASPASGSDYNGSFKNNVVTLIAEPSDGDSVNGHTVAISFAAGSNLGTVSTTTVDVNGGTDTTGIYDSAAGYRFYLDADYGSSSDTCSGEGSAVVGDKSNAIEITKYLVMRGVQTHADQEELTISSGRITPNRIASIKRIIVDTEASASTDNLDTIDATNDFVDNDVVELVGKDSARKTTVRDSQDNIYLTNSNNFTTGDQTVRLTLEYRNDPNNGPSFYEIYRSTSPGITVSDMRGASIPQPVSGTDTINLTAGGGTTSFDPDADEGYQIITGSPTLTASWTFQGGGTPKDGDTFLVDYRATPTVGGNNVTIFGITLTDNQAASGALLVRATYDATAAGWKARLFADLSQSDVVENSHIKEVSGAKLTSNSVSNTAIATDAVRANEIKDGEVGILELAPTLRVEDLAILVSFETGEQGEYRYHLSYDAKVELATFRATLAIAGTDDGTITLGSTAGDMAGGVITAQAGSVFGTEANATPSSNQNISAGSHIKITTNKTTAGGKGVLIIKISRT